MNHSMRKPIVISIFIFYVLGFLFPVNLQAQILESDSIFHKKRFYTVVAVEASLWSASLIGLNYAWYKDYQGDGFHLFDDSKEWLQVDKFGHATTTYYIGKVGYDMLRWSGVSEKKSILYGGSLGFFYMSAIEIFDGYSSGWGFSWSDMAANVLGSGLFMGQQALWGEQRMSMKYSFHTTQYAQYRPNILGRTISEQMVKDYNGHTYWLSVNVNSFLKSSSRFPKWINLALGYGAEGMLGGFENPSEIDGVPLPYFDRYRQYYFSLDVDLSRIPTHSKFLRSVLNVLSFIKIPMPTVEFSKKGIEFYPLYF